MDELYGYNIYFPPILLGLYFPLFQHKGIIVNFEDFKGMIEFKFCDFSKNMIFIPYIYNSPIKTSTGYTSLSDFREAYYGEYYFARCNDET